MKPYWNIPLKMIIFFYRIAPFYSKPINNWSYEEAWKQSVYSKTKSYMPLKQAENYLLFSV